MSVSVFERGKFYLSFSLSSFMFLLQTAHVEARPVQARGLLSV